MARSAKDPSPKGRRRAKAPGRASPRTAPKNQGAASEASGRSAAPDLLEAWFLGPKAEHGDIWERLVSYTLQDYLHWRRNYFPHDPPVIARAHRRDLDQWFDLLISHLDSLLGHLKAHFPFYSPRYIAHMLSEQTLPSVIGYFAGMLYNPNNVTGEAAPVTVQLELEVGRMVAEMLGYNPRRAWAHLCSGGTTANLEALWVARTAQFIPFVAREYCEQGELDLEVQAADGSKARLQDLGNAELIALRPQHSLSMLRTLARSLIQERGRSKEAAFQEVRGFYEMSAYNPNRQGLLRVAGQVGLKPVLFASASAHYSIKKVANLLGYGEDAVRLVPVTSRFRIDLDALHAMMFRLHPEEYVAAVIGVVGTTEEGAVDPIHRLRFLRDEFQSERRRSFWLHVDAAWGGYICSLFRGLPLERRHRKRGIKEICQDYAEAIQAHDQLLLGSRKTPVSLRWDDPQVYAAFLAMADADSITVDPHKMGYVPYPAGIVAFRNGQVTDLVAQRAHYLGETGPARAGLDDQSRVEAIGPFILEGSKPGAAAASCWLAHTTIPLEFSGHGKIVRSSLLNAKKLTRHLQYHRRSFNDFEKAAGFRSQSCLRPFTFVPLHEPDTNIVCFVVAPMTGYRRGLVRADLPLRWLNRLNILVHRALSIDVTEPVRRPPYEQPFFVSKTIFENSQYQAGTLRRILDFIGVSASDYRQEGLFVLRSTVMNPLYQIASQQGKDYLQDFVLHLHTVARRAMANVHEEMESQAKSPDSHSP